MSRIVKADFDAKLYEAIETQKLAAKAYHDAPPAWMDGIGERTMAIDPLFVWIANQKFGQDTTMDPDFWEWLRSKEDAFRVRSVSPKTQVGYRAPAGQAIHAVQGGERRYRKVYPCNAPMPAGS